MKCSNCDYVNKEGAVFCANCGNSLASEKVEKEVLEENRESRCSNCSYLNKEGAVFCANCGNSLKTEEPVPVEGATKELEADTGPSMTEESLDENRKNCPNCGYTNKYRAVFCANCGSSLTIDESKTADKFIEEANLETELEPEEIPEEEIEEKGIICSNCQYINKEAATFCANCGESLIEDAVEEDQEVESEPEEEEKVDSVPVLIEEDVQEDSKEETPLIDGQICPNCGYKNPGDVLYCGKCGQSLKEGPVEKEKVVAAVPADEVIPQQEKKQKKKKKTGRLTKFIIALVIFLLLLIGGAYVFGRNYYSREKQIERHMEVLKTEDSGEIANLLNSEDSAFEITSETIEPFIAYLQEDQEHFDKIEKDLKSQEDTQSLDVYLKEKGSYFKLFDKYELVMNPVYANLYTNQENTVLKMGETELVVSDTSNFLYEVGPLAPGNYIFSAYLDETVTPMEVEKDITLLTADYNKNDFDAGDTENIDLSLDGLRFSISSNFGDGVVYLDDQELGELSADGDGDFGPIGWTENAELFVRFDTSFGEVESAIRELEDVDQKVYYFPMPDLSTDQAANLLSDIYQDATNLTQSVFESVDLDSFADQFINGTDNAVYNTFVNKGKELREDSDVSRVVYSTMVSDLTQIDTREYEVRYELTVQTIRPFGSDQEDTEDILPFKAIMEIVDRDLEGTSFDEAYQVKFKSVELE